MSLPTFQSIKMFFSQPSEYREQQGLETESLVRVRDSDFTPENPDSYAEKTRPWNPTGEGHLTILQNLSHDISPSALRKLSWASQLAL